MSRGFIFSHLQLGSHPRIVDSISASLCCCNLVADDLFGLFVSSMLFSQFHSFLSFALVASGTNLNIGYCEKGGRRVRKGSWRHYYSPIFSSNKRGCQYAITHNTIQVIQFTDFEYVGGRSCANLKSMDERQIDQNGVKLSVF